MNFKNITKSVLPAAAAGVGIIAARKVQDLIPVGNEYIRAGIVAAGGIFLATRKQPVLQGFGVGMAGQGIAQLVVSFIPGLTGVSMPYLAGTGYMNTGMGDATASTDYSNEAYNR